MSSSVPYDPYVPANEEREADSKTAALKSVCVLMC